MGLVPKQTKTEIKVSRGLTLYRMFGLIVTFMMSAMIGQSVVYGKLLLPFIIYCAVVFLILTAKSPTNPNKSFGKGLIEFLSFSKNIKEFYGSNSDEYKRSVEHKTHSDKKRRKK